MNDEGKQSVILAIALVVAAAVMVVLYFVGRAYPVHDVMGSMRCTCEEPKHD